MIKRATYFAGGAIAALLAIMLVGPTSGARHTSVVDVVKRAGPAVVNVNTEQVIVKGSNPFMPFSADPFFNEYFRDFFDPRYGRRRVRQSLGSGVIIDAAGHVLTNEHVVLGAGSVMVNLMDGRGLKADIIGVDPESDLAVLKLRAGGSLPFVAAGNSDDIMVGEPAIAIGNPFGLGHTVTAGVISATRRSIQTEDRLYLDFIQTDASINPGNSGGPLLNADGEMIGINSAIYQKGQGIGFAIPVNRARRVVEDLIRYGEVQIGWLGMQVRDLTEVSAQNLGYNGPGGVAVSLIMNGGPAQQAGVKYGDIIEEVNGMSVRTKEDFGVATRQLQIGKTARLKVSRKTGRTVIDVRTTEFPLDRAEEIARFMLGIGVRPYTGGGSGVAISSVTNGSPAARIGLKPGDVILKINNSPIKGIPDWQKAVSKIRMMENALLLVRRGQNVYYVTLPISS